MCDSRRRIELAPALFILLVAVGSAETTSADYQAQVVLTVSEGKRLIAKAVTQLPVVRGALAKGTVIVCKGTTNTYVAEELLGQTIEHGAFVLGRTFPARRDQGFGSVKPIKEVVFMDGKRVDMDWVEALRELEPGDVVIKGGNALNHDEKVVGVIATSMDGGTSGKVVPYVTARKAHLVIPIGLEKQVSGDVIHIADTLRQPVASSRRIPSMFPLRGHIVTEIEALEILTDVTAIQIGAGGVGGAEGAVRLLIRGTKTAVEEALEVVNAVHGEPPFAPCDMR
jgi:hypothetical protein